MGAAMEITGGLYDILIGYNLVQDHHFDVDFSPHQDHHGSKQLRDRELHPNTTGANGIVETYCRGGGVYRRTSTAEP